MRPDERVVAGLSCSDVMADLSAYLDRELDGDRARQLEAHVADCHLCASFGAAFAGLIDQVRSRLRQPDDVPGHIAARLRL